VCRDVNYAKRLEQREEDEHSERERLRALAEKQPRGSMPSIMGTAGCPMLTESETRTPVLLGGKERRCAVANGRPAQKRSLLGKVMEAHRSNIH
jgi:hypothetical protein